jgi:hypothetical protein
MMTSTPILQPAGQGLPWVEALIVRYVVFPVQTALLSRDKAIDLLEADGQAILAIVQQLTPEQLIQQRLIKRLPGLEDSSRYWSALMTIEHLLITSTSMTRIITHLATGYPLNLVVRIEDVKPTPQNANPETLITAYQQFLAGYRAQIVALADGNFTATSHNHPWFGPINAHQWLCLNAIHHGIHLRQLKAIVSQLGPQD